MHRMNPRTIEIVLTKDLMPRVCIGLYSGGGVFRYYAKNTYYIRGSLNIAPVQLSLMRLMGCSYKWKTNINFVLPEYLMYVIAGSPD